MERPPRTVFLSVLVAALFLPWGTAGFAAASPDRQELRFLGAAFDPLLDPLPAGAALRDLTAEGPFLVQFPYPLDGTEKPRVEAAGGAVVGYIPDGAMLVVGPRGFGRTLSEVHGVRWAGLLPAEIRIAEGARAASTLSLQYVGDVRVLVSELKVLRATAIVLGVGFAIVEAGPSGAAALAALPNVLWVAPYAAPEAANYKALLTDHIRQLTNGSSYSTGSGALWAFNPDVADPGFIGYTGAGVTIDVTDLGVDGSHPAFAGRMAAAKSWSTTPVWVDTDGHGTHVAATALGSGAFFPWDAAGPFGLYAGAAPGARLVAQTMNEAAMNYTGMADFAASSGATISSNSWGSALAATLGCYTLESSLYDNATIDAGSSVGNQPLLFVFAAGNKQNAPRSITPPGTGKNVITVGATGNDYPSSFGSDFVTSLASYGPTSDGRVKPDLVAPGDYIASARANGTAAVGPVPPDGGASYAYLSGTSQAAPQVAGAAAVAYQFLEESRGVLATPALVKALLINGATPLSAYAWPGPEQGWGRLDLGASLLNTTARRVDFVPETSNNTLRTRFQGNQYNVTVDGGAEFRVTLVWSDVPAAPMAASALVNDLDLEVRDANDTVIFSGNQINTTTGFSIPGTGSFHDSVNNVEVVRIASAAAGVWKIFVSAGAIYAPQSYALAYSGAINRSYADLAVDATERVGAPSPVESGDNVTVAGSVENYGGEVAATVSVEAVPAEDPLAPPFDTFPIFSVAPGERVPFTLSFFPPDGGNTITIRVTSASPDTDPANNQATVAFFVIRRQPQLSGATDMTALPGDPAVFALTATNRGNVNDTFTLEEGAAIRDLGWGLSFSRQQFELDAGASASFLAFIQVPANASDGDFTQAEIKLASALNASRTDFLTLTARAGPVHTLVVEPLVAAVVALPGETEGVPVRVTNTGNAEEGVTVSLTSLWTDAGGWSGSSQVATIPAGASKTFLVNLTNADSAQAGYRGLLRLRASVASSGEAFDAEIPVFVQAIPCLHFDAAPDIDAGGAASGVATLTLRNCGNFALTGSLSAEGAPGLTFTGPSTFGVGAGVSADLAFAATVTGVDGGYEATVRADATQGIGAVANFVVKYRSPVALEATGAPVSVTLHPGVNDLAIVVHNGGGAGPVLAPNATGFPAGWTVTVTPNRVEGGSGTDVTFHVTIDTGSNSMPGTYSGRLAFYPGSSREGELEVSIDATVPGASPPLKPPTATPLWPTSASAGVAMLTGLGAIALGALVLAPSRALLRTCPACGQVALRFDTYMNPRCARCGEPLTRATKTRGERHE